MTLVYDKWLNFSETFSFDKDSATVVGMLFFVIKTLILSMQFLMTGHITMAGAAKRQAIEAIALALLFSKHELPYLKLACDDKLYVNTAIDKIIKHKEELYLNNEGLQIMKQAKNFYNKFSHPTFLALGDSINLDGFGCYLGSSFDESKLPFYEKEVYSRLGLSKILINIIEGVTQQMYEWPFFVNRHHTE